MPHREIKGIPSVTQILSVMDKPFLKRWYGTLGWEECERIKNESADYGTKIHEYVSRHLKGEVVEGVTLVSVFASHYKELGRKAIEVEPEEPYQSKKYGYQGTFDWVEKDADGTLVIADLKITGRIYKEMGLQLAAYAQLYNEKHGTKIVTGRIYRLDKKTGKLQIKEFVDLPKYFKVFKCLIPVHRWIYEGNNE